jgi:hypothetical protein
MRSRSASLVLAISISIIGCGDPDPNPNRPKAPSENDPAFATQGLQSWYLVGDPATPAQNQITALVQAPDGADFVDMYIPGMKPYRTISQDGLFGIDLSIENLPAGAHEVLFSMNGSDTAFASYTLNRSAAYYVLVTTDFDFAEPGMNALNYTNELHTNHPELVMTHFWAPYTYTDPGVTAQRKNELDTWIKSMRDDHGDEIGLHIHPWCHFVVSAGLTCITEGAQSTTMPSGDTSGYTIKLAAYERAPMAQLFERAKAIFNERGLGTPVTFRAGGWTADINTMHALADTGFIADTSALNWIYIAEEWADSELLNWNMTNWAPINDTSQPYYPSTTNVLTNTPAPNLSVLQVPDNGVMIDYVSSQQMIAIFDANWDGQPFDAPRTLMMGYHPAPSMPRFEITKVNDLLNRADQHLAARGTGPVVYITLENVTAAFPPL